MQYANWKCANDDVTEITNWENIRNAHGGVFIVLPKVKSAGDENAIDKQFYYQSQIEWVRHNHLVF